MSTAKEKLDEIIENLNELEITEVIDFADFINNRKQSDTIIPKWTDAETSSA